MVPHTKIEKKAACHSIGHGSGFSSSVSVIFFICKSSVNSSFSSNTCRPESSSGSMRGSEEFFPEFLKSSRLLDKVSNQSEATRNCQMKIPPM